MPRCAMALTHKSESKRALFNVTSLSNTRTILSSIASYLIIDLRQTTLYPSHQQEEHSRLIIPHQREVSIRSRLI